LFVNEGFTSAIDALPDARRAALLRALFAHQSRPEFTLRWRCEPGDVAIWDNRSTIHYAVNDYGKAHPAMRGATIVGDSPY
ncbi:TauD/TfdA family dioxygenase, partial [Burkholderia pseudomallei]|uniref:TauD/TfdA family dioxygenase n=1 Tax=Burkholderia pseudomallei TaxID=28450 RepID=UPI00158A2932